MKKQTLRILTGLLLVASSCVQTPITQTTQNESQEEVATTSPAADFSRFVGEYATRPNENIRIFVEGKDLKIQGPGQPEMVLAATENPKKFYLKEFDVHIEFAGQDDQITKLLMIRWDGQALESPKIK